MLKAYAFAHRTLCAKFTDALEHNIVERISRAVPLLHDMKR